MLFYRLPKFCKFLVFPEELLEDGNDSCEGAYWKSVKAIARAAPCLHKVLSGAASEHRPVYLPEKDGSALKALGV